MVSRWGGGNSWQLAVNNWQKNNSQIDRNQSRIAQLAPTRRGIDTNFKARVKRKGCKGKEEKQPVKSET